MRKLIALIAIGLLSYTVWGQTLETGKVVEYSLPAEDCNKGVFYIGKFGTGTYEISANIAGYDANSCGWKVLVGKNWGRPIVLNELTNTIGGSFHAMQEGTSTFHLWWKSEYKNINKLWYPHIKIECQLGGIIIDAEEPTDLTNATKVISVINKRSTTIQMLGLKVNGLVTADEIRVEDIAATNMNLSGNIAANNITLTTNGQTADFVFEPEYQLKDLTEVENFIKTHKHLPNIPSAEEMEKQGVNLAEMNKLLLQKIEELTLYSIELDKARREESGGRKKLQNDVEKLKERLAKIEALLIKK